MAQTRSLTGRVNALLRENPEIALLVAFELGKIAAAAATGRAFSTRALVNTVTAAASRNGATAALAAFAGTLLGEASAPTARAAAVRARGSARRIRGAAAHIERREEGSSTPLRG